MSKTSKIVLAIVGIFALAGASGYFGAGLNDSSGNSSSAASESYLDQMKARGELRVGVAISPPMTTKDASGKITGPNLIPLENLAKELRVKLVVVEAQWSNIVAGLQAGRYDFASNLDATVQRAVAIQYSNPVYSYQGVFLVKGDSPYMTVEDLKADGGAIATAQGSATEAAVKGMGFKVLSVDTFENAFAALKAGRAIASFTDLPVIEGGAQADPTMKILVPDPPVYSADASYGVPVTMDPHSLQAVNIAISNARDSGQMTQAYTKVGYREINNLGDLQKK